MAEVIHGQEYHIENVSSVASWQSLKSAAISVLRTPCPFEKARLTALVAQQWRSESLPVNANEEDSVKLAVPDSPARPVAPDVKGSRVRSGKMRSMLHGVCHAESYAIDLMWDSVARFAEDDGEGGQAPPREFFDEWVTIASDEARHFLGWASHIKSRYSTEYGDLPTHEMLWEVAFATRHSLRARLAVVHLVHEARGLDVAPTMRARCIKAQDVLAAEMLDRNITDEVRHVNAGVRWFKYLCARNYAGAPFDAGADFSQLVQKHYVGHLQRPFNTELRNVAELEEAWYLPLAEPKGHDAEEESGQAQCGDD